LAVGRYEDARRWASEGFERARGGPDVWRAGLAWRAIARFRLGDWDGALEDYQRMEEARAVTLFGTTGYFTLTMWSCIALLHELRGERAAADRLIARLSTELAGGTPTVRVIPFVSRVFAHRGSDEAFARIESSASLIGREMGWGVILEARCDVTAELGRFELADETVAEARAFAARGQLEALPLYADRLEGRACLARADATSAVAPLASARAGFARIGARWEAALAQLWLGEAQLALGDVEDARRSATDALEVFDELRSARERDLARSLLDRAG
jgi:tetratricopeptide (TPR) repeat protein